MKYLFTTGMSLLAVCIWFFPAIAQHQHGGHAMPGIPGIEGEKKSESAIGNETSPRRTFLLDGGFRATFSIMPMGDHKKMLQEMKMKVEVDSQATHNIAVTLISAGTNLPVNEAVVKMKVISPAGREEVKLLDQIPAMKQYSGDFALAEKGRYQILILFKADGKKQAGGFYYRLE
jgi:hypothetical protein